MAGTSKPNVEELGQEAQYNVLSYNNSNGNTSGICGLFDGKDTQILDETNFYWYMEEKYYVEIEILSESVNIWKIGYGSPYIAPLKIYKYNDSTSQYENITSQITQTLVAGKGEWEKFISNLPKGKYKFCGNPDVGGSYRLDSEWYIEESDTSTKIDMEVKEFPIKVADDSVQTEDDVLSYAKTLVNGEKQLLVSEILKSLYVTDGQGGMTKISTGGSNGNVNIDDKNIAEDKVYSNQKTQELIDDVIDKTLDKETYASETNEGAVKYADNLSVTLKAQPLQYYGTNNENELGMHYFPINTKDNTGLEQRVCLNAKANQIITVDSALDISDNKVLVQCYKFVEGEKDIISTIKTFNNTEKDNFFYDEDNIEFTDSMHIKKEHEINSRKNSKGYYETDVIDKKLLFELVNIEEGGIV